MKLNKKKELADRLAEKTGDDTIKHTFDDNLRVNLYNALNNPFAQRVRDELDLDISHHFRAHPPGSEIQSLPMITVMIPKIELEEEEEELGLGPEEGLGFGPEEELVLGSAPEEELPELGLGMEEEPGMEELPPLGPGVEDGHQPYLLQGVHGLIDPCQGDARHPAYLVGAAHAALYHAAEGLGLVLPEAHILEKRLDFVHMLDKKELAG